MLDAGVEEATGELAEMLAAPVDPRELPTRFSLLKRMAQSPAHYLHAAQQPQDDSLASRLGGLSGAPGASRTEALRFGTAVHYMWRGEGHRVARFVGRRQGKAWADFQAGAVEDGANEILNEREHAIATDVVASLHRNAEAMRLLLDGTIVERRVDWTWLGKACRSTPDAYRAGDRIVDLKTTVSAAPAAFVRHAERLHYHAQLAFYRSAVEEPEIPCFVVAVEKAAPYPVTVFRLTERALAVGARLCRLWMEQLRACEAAGTWPEYADGVVPFDLDVDDEAFELEIGGQAWSFSDG